MFVIGTLHLARGHEAALKHHTAVVLLLFLGCAVLASSTGAAVRVCAFDCAPMLHVIGHVCGSQCM